MNIVFVSHTSMVSEFVVGSHHLARAMAAMRHTVVHISAPITLGHLATVFQRDFGARFRNWLRGGEVHDGVFDYVPLAPIPWQAITALHLPHALFSVTVPAVPDVIRRRGMESVDLMIVDEPRLVGLVDLVHPHKLIYRATDLYAQMRNDPSISIAETSLLRRCDRAIATSLPVSTHLRGLESRIAVDVFENGVDVRDFARRYPEPEELRPIPRPRAIYVGAFDRRFDPELVRAAAAKIPLLQIVLVGPESAAARAALKSLPNVHWFGPKPYSMIPALLQHCDVGLVPLSADPSNTGRSPMKIYEYGMSGLPIVATNTSELRRRNLPFVRLVESADAFAAAVADHLADRSIETVRLQAREVSRRMDWSHIATSILTAVDQPRA